MSSIVHPHTGAADDTVMDMDRLIAMANQIGDFSRLTRLFGV